MPLNKKEGESDQDYLGRCIGIEISNGIDPSQAAAICHSKLANMNEELAKCKATDAIMKVRKKK